METIETSILKGLVYDPDYALKVTPYLKPEYFEDSYLTVYNIFSDYYEKYNKCPSIKALVVGLQSSKVNEADFDACVDILKHIDSGKNEQPETQWLVDETESYCRDKAAYNAIFKSISILEGNDKLGKGAIPDLLSDAVSIDFNDDLGVDYLESALERYEYYTDEESLIKLPLEVLNTIFSGGLRRKALYAMLAATNFGKSAMMCYLAGELLKLGYNVVYFSMEMSEEAVQERVDANLLDISTEDLRGKKLSKEEFLSRFDKIRKSVTGNFIVKQYPTGGGHAGHFKTFLTELERKKGIKPDVVFFDYINICDSKRYAGSGSVNSYTKVKTTAEELRALGVEMDFAGFTATQTTREGSNSASPDVTDTSESIGLPQTLDGFIGGYASDELRELGQQCLKLLKTRFGNRSKIPEYSLVGIDFDKMRYYDVQQAEAKQQAEKDENIKKTIAKNSKSSKLNTIANDIDWDSEDYPRI